VGSLIYALFAIYLQATAALPITEGSSVPPTNSSLTNCQNLCTSFVDCHPDCNESVTDIAGSKHSADISTDSADSDGLEHGSDCGDISLGDNIYSCAETQLLDTGEYSLNQVFIYHFRCDF
jgi:hypothetical protein